MQTKRISEVSKSLGVSSQTVRNYLKIGPEFFSEHATRKTRKQFTAEDIVQLRSIKSHLANGVSYSDIPGYLTPAPRVVGAGQEPDPDPEPPPQTSAIEKQYQAIIATQQHGHEREIASKNEFIEYLQNENDRLRTDLENTRQPWYKRIFGNNPK